MEETAEKSTVFTKLATFLGRHDRNDEDTDRPQAMHDDRVPLRIHHKFAYHVTVRRNIVSFQDAVSAAEGLKRGEAQVLNLTQAPAELREKIKDFMCGCQFMADAHMEELGDHVYLLAPAHAEIEVAGAGDARVKETRN